MRKIGFLLSTVILIGFVSVTASGQDQVVNMAPITIEQLQGTWVKEDGTYFTFNGNEFEFVDMENGSAGYGRFRVTRYHMIYTGELILSLGETNRGIPPEGSIQPKEFQLKALEEYRRIHNITPDPRRFNLRETQNGRRHAYQFDGEVLDIEVLPGFTRGWKNAAFAGRFTKQEQNQE